MCQQLLKHIGESSHPVVIHLVRFPQLTINHAMVLFDSSQNERETRFIAYDPNQPEKPTTLIFDRASKTFILPANKYFAGGRVDVYEVYHQWNY